MPSGTTSLSALLKGHALDVYALLPSDKALDYNALKDALLKRYDMTEDGYKRKFRSCRPEQGETFSQFTVRLSGYLFRWLEMSLTSNTFEYLFDLVMRDQLLHICNRDLTLFLKERSPKQKRSTEGCSKFKGPETRQVQERLVSTLEHMQVPK